MKRYIKASTSDIPEEYKQELLDIADEEWDCRDTGFENYEMAESIAYYIAEYQQTWDEEDCCSQSLVQYIRENKKKVQDFLTSYLYSKFIW